MLDVCSFAAQWVDSYRMLAGLSIKARISSTVKLQGEKTSAPYQIAIEGLADEAGLLDHFGGRIRGFCL